MGSIFEAYVITYVFLKRFFFGEFIEFAKGIIRLVRA